MGGDSSRHELITGGDEDLSTIARNTSQDVQQLLKRLVAESIDRMFENHRDAPDARRRSGGNRQSDGEINQSSLPCVG